MIPAQNQRGYILSSLAFVMLVRRLCIQNSTTSGSKSFGYSLIELLLVIAILSTLTITGTVMYRSFQARQLLIQTAENFRTDLRFAQNQALSGVKNCPGGGTLLGWKVVLESDRYRTHIVCLNPDETTLYRSKLLPEGISISAVPVALTDILFRPINRSVMFTTSGGADLGTSAQITFTNTTDNEIVEVRSSGDIL